MASALQFDKSREQFVIARQIAPLKLSIIVNQGYTEYESGDYETAHKFFTDAYHSSPRIDPEDDKIRILYFSTLILTKRRAEAMAMLESMSDKDILDSLLRSDIVGQALITAGEHDILKQLLTIKVKNNPQDAGARIDLATIYYQTGDKLTATQILKEAKTATQQSKHCLLYTSPSPRDRTRSRMPSSA